MTLSHLRERLHTLSPYHFLTGLVSLLLIFALALLPLPTIALLIFYGALLILPLCDPVFGLYWAILSVPVQELVHLPGGVSYTQAAMALAIGAWALRVLAHPERRLVAGRLLPLWGVFLWVLLLAAVLSPYSRAEGIKETLRWFETFLIWLMIVNLADRSWKIAGVIVCLLLAPAAEAALGIVQFVNGDGPPSFRIAPNLPFVRAYGTHGQPNSFAGYLNMAWPLALALAIGMSVWLWRRLGRHGDTETRRHGDTETRRHGDTETRRHGDTETRRHGDTETRRHGDIASWISQSPGLPVSVSLVALLWLAAGVLLAALVASLSRGAWVGALIGGLGMAFALGRRARRWGLAAVGCAVLALALGGAGLLPGFLAQRIDSVTRYMSFFDAGTAVVTPENFAIVERMSQMQAGWRMLLAHPLTGVGPGNYTPAYPDFAVGTWYASRGQAHNYYIHMAAETGIIGVLAYLALLAGVAYQAALTLSRVSIPFWRYAAIGCCGIIAAVAGHDLFENLHVLSMGIQLAAVWGLLLVLDRNASSE